MPRTLKMLPFALAIVAIASVALGATKVSSSKFRLDGMPLVVTSQNPGGATATELGVDSDRTPTKHAIVHRWSINGQEVDVLIRIQTSNGSLYVDMVADATITSLTTTVNGFNLTGIGHPTPQKDKTDGQAMTAAGGS